MCDRSGASVYRPPQIRQFAFASCQHTRGFLIREPVVIDKRGQLSQLFALYCVLLAQLSRAIRKHGYADRTTLGLMTMKLLENIRVVAIETVARDPCEATQLCHRHGLRSGIRIPWTAQRLQCRFESCLGGAASLSPACCSITARRYGHGNYPSQRNRVNEGACAPLRAANERSSGSAWGVRAR
jgi:hypothetical protein